MTAAIFGLLGVIVGGVLNGAVSWWLRRSESRSTSRAIARIVYDDFLHMQSTVVRALAANQWWQSSHLLKEQVSPSDWQLLLGTLDDKSSESVAAARGWMAYLIASRDLIVAEHESGSRKLKLVEAERHQLQDSFCRLDDARRKLSKYSGRDFRSFENGGVLATLEKPTTLKDLGIAGEECRARRKVSYAARDVA